MGLIISRFKKKKTTLEVLEKLEKDIKSIELYRMNTEQRRRRIVGQLIVYSVGAYVLAAALFYFYWFPNTFKEQMLCATPLLLFPFLVILFKKVVTFYYSRKITHNEQKLCTLREEKKRILEDVMDKETYKVARTILEKFAPEQLRSKGLELSRSPDKLNLGNVKNTLAARQTSETPLHPSLSSKVATSELRQRAVPSSIDQRTGLRAQQSSSAQPFTPFRGTQPSSRTPMPSPRPSINGQGFNSEFRPPGPPLPRPVLPRERSYLDRFVEYLVGDGPANRFALICKACESHNGMALKEEFEYLPFRCCYCHYWNPARKQRPVAPRLTQTSGTGSQLSVAREDDDDTSDSEKNSDSDSSDDDSGPELECLSKSTLGAESNENEDLVKRGHEPETLPEKELGKLLKCADDGTFQSLNLETEEPSTVEEQPTDLKE